MFQYEKLSHQPVHCANHDRDRNKVILSVIETTLRGNVLTGGRERRESESLKGLKSETKPQNARAAIFRSKAV